MLNDEDLKRSWKLPSSATSQYYLGRRLLEAHASRSHISAIVFGAKRIGKSVYALKVMEDIFKAFGMDEKEAWRYAINSNIYTLKDFLQLSSRLAEMEEPYPVLTIDDAGVGFSHLLRFSPEAQALKGVFDTIGVLVSGLIYTTPNPSGLLHFMRSDVQYRIKIVKESETMRLACVVHSTLTPKGDVEFSTERGLDADRYLVLLEDWKYRQYDIMRRSYSKQAVKRAIDAVLSEKKEEAKKEIGEEAEEVEVPCHLCNKQFPLYEIQKITIQDSYYFLCPECYERYLHPRKARTQSTSSSPRNDFPINTPAM